MAESNPLTIPIRFDTTGAEQDLNQLEERAKKGVTVPTRGADGGAPTRQGGTPVPSRPGTADDGGAFQNAVADAFARGDSGTGRRLAAQAQALGIPVSLPPEADRGAAARSARVDRNWEQASFAQFRQTERAEERLRVAREREARAAERNAERAERVAARVGEADYNAGLAGMGPNAQLRALRDRAATEQDPMMRSRLQSRMAGLRGSTGLNTELFGTGMYMNFLFGGMEVAHAYNAVASANRFAENHPGDLLGQLKARNAANEKITGGFLGSLVGMAFQSKFSDVAEATTGAEQSVLDVARNQSRIAATRAVEMSAATTKRETYALTQQDKTSRAIAESQNRLVQYRADLREQRRKLQDKSAVETDPAEWNRLQKDLAAFDRGHGTFVDQQGFVSFHGADAKAVEDREYTAQMLSRIDAAKSIRSQQLSTTAIQQRMQGSFARAALNDIESKFLATVQNGVVTGFGGKQYRTAQGERLPGIDDQEYEGFQANASRYRAEQTSALLDRIRQTQLLGINLGGRERQMAALLKRDPTSAAVAGIVAQTRTEEYQLRAAGFGPEADRARRIGQDELRLTSQEYREGFRAVERERGFGAMLRQSEGTNPAEILKNIEDGIKDLGQPGTIAGPGDVPRLLGQMLGELETIAKNLILAN